eukprot:SAG11_NODE_2046_length_3884_cov_2.228005_2_plen_118_part_00
MHHMTLYTAHQNVVPGKWLHAAVPGSSLPSEQSQNSSLMCEAGISFSGCERHFHVPASADPISGYLETASGATPRVSLSLARAVVKEARAVVATTSVNCIVRALGEAAAGCTCLIYS